MAEEIFEMDDEKTPAEFVEEDAVVSDPTRKEQVADKDDEPQEPPHECTVVDPGLLAAFMAAHPEDELAKQAAPQKEEQKAASKAASSAKSGAEQPVKRKKPAPVPPPTFEDEGEPPEGKTSIASLADIEAMAAEMASEHSKSKEVKRVESEAPAAAPRSGKSGSSRKRPSSSAAPAPKKEPEFSFDEGNTLNAPVEEAIKPILDDLPRAKKRSRPTGDQQHLDAANSNRPVVSAPVEEMEDMWDGIDDEDMNEWSARSAEHKAPDFVSAPQEAKATDVPRQDTRKIAPGQKDELKEEGRLICLTGAMHGQEFPVTAHDISIGRQDGNTITIRDPSLSRIHASIVKNEDVYVVIDNKSSNGTFVNGQRVDRARLHSGDEVAFGNITFRFVELGDAFKPGSMAQQNSPLERAAAAQQPAAVNSKQPLGSGKKPPKRLIAVGMGSVTLLALLFGTIINKVRTPSETPVSEAQIRALYNDGVAAYKGRKWVDGLRYFSTLSQLEPSSKLTARYIKRIRIESEIEQRLVGIQNSITKGALQEAANLLAKLPSDTVYTAEVAGIKGQIDGESQKLLAEVKKVLDGDAVAEALPMIETLRAQVPLTFTEQLDDLQEMANQKINQAKDKEVAAAQAAANRGPRKVVDNTGDRAVALFKERKLSAALSLLASKGAPNPSAPADLVSLHNKIAKFDDAYQYARQDWQAKAVDDAVPSLRRALSMEAKIANGKSAYAQELHQWLADMLYIKGMRAFSAKKYPEAYQNFQEAINNYPGHNQSRNKLNEISNMAENLYRQAYIVKNSDSTQCKALLNQAIRMVSSTDPVYAKAREMLSTLP